MLHLSVSEGTNTSLPGDVRIGFPQQHLAPQNKYQNPNGMSIANGSGLVQESTNILDRSTETSS